jgi:hypothetical protein
MQTERTLREISLPLRGGCMCGACRYELRAAPFMVYVCHCTDCQRQSGSAFGMSMPASRDALFVTQGDPARFERTMASGRTGVIRFCGICATRLFTESTEAFVAVRPGTLDDTSWLVPAAQNWVRSAHRWAFVGDIPSYPENPEDFAIIAQRWRAQGLRFVNA